MKGYWTTWLVLLAFTAAMLWIDSISLPRAPFVMAMILAMLVKASIIAARFMHLKVERPALVLMVVVGLLVTGTVLYALIAPDAVRIHRRLQQQ
jgi:cytochrome c oxidase subunit IV